MMKTSHSKIIFKAPFNDLSFGQVSYNLAKSMFKKNMDVSIFPIGNSINISCYDKIDKNFFEWLKYSIENRYSSINRSTPSLQLWHLRDSDSCPTSKSYLFTFHELLGVTENEKIICNLHDKVIFSSSFSKENFSSNGLSNCEYANIGFDEDLEIKNKNYFEDIIHYGLVGKFESRKNTKLIIETWLSLFGNNKNFRLTCLIDNPFFDKETMTKLTASCLNDKDYFNITFLPRLKTNSEMCDFYNSIDIDLSGLSSAEGWNLPAFNSTALGKWSCVANHTAHKDWANSENCILVEPDVLRSPYDNAFFRKGDQFNQGLIYNISKNSIEEALIKSQSFAKKNNENGQKLRNQFSYEKTLEKILYIMESKDANL